MRKIGLLALAIVLGLGLVGAGFAYWNETLNIDADVDTGELKMEFKEGKLGGFFNPPIWYPGSDDDGIGLFDSGKDIKYYVLFDVIPVRGDYDVGECTIEKVDSQTYRVTLGNVYPGYMAKVWWAMHNTGTIPAKIKSVSLEDIDDPDGLMQYVKAAGRVKIQIGTLWFWRIYTKDWFNCDAWYNNPGLLSEMPGKLQGKLGGYVIQPGWRVLIGCADDEEEVLDEEGNSLLFVIDENAPDSIEGATLSFDLKMIWTQFNA